LKTIYISSKKGMVRAYFESPDKDYTFWLGKEGDPIFSLKSYVHKETGYETIELLENSILYEVKISDLKQLYTSNLEIVNWGRKLAEIGLIKIEELFISRQFKSPSERYQDLMRENPEILQRVPLKIIASYLGSQFKPNQGKNQIRLRESENRIICK